jgi:phosphoglycolate phosphatase
MELTSLPNSPAHRPKAIIFDWDNTLVDSWPVIGDALNTTLTAYGHEPWTPNEVRSRVRKSMRESFPDLFGDKWQDAAELFYARYGEIHAELIEPIDGIEEMLAELTACEIYLAVVSNKTGKYLRLEADHLDWTRYFGPIIGAMDAKQDKPAKDPVLLAMQDGPILGDPWNPNDIWFVGDTDIDMECALNANCTPVLLRKNTPEPGEFDTFPPQFEFQTGQALCKSLRTLYA